MASIFSTISGQFSKSLILGAFAPAATFVVLGLIFVVPLLPGDWTWLNALQGLDLQGKLIVITLITIVLSLILYNLNGPIIRLYEGYPWLNTWIGKWSQRRYQATFDVLLAQSAALAALGIKLSNQEKPNQTQFTQVTDELGRIGLKLYSEFPNERALVLPTRLGNIMRSYECYPEVQYSMSAIPLWPRLIAVIKSDYATAIDAAETSFSFMLNCSMLSGLFAAIMLLSGLAHPVPLASFAALIPWLLEIVAFVILCLLFYMGAIPRASARGNLVKSAFDLYRADLLKQLGFTQTPTTKASERKLWHEISQQMLFGDSFVRGPRINYASPAPPLVQGAPSDVKLEMTRGMEQPWFSSQLTVVFRIKNCDDKREAKNVVVTDAVPTGYSYQWNSAQLARAGLAGPTPVPVVGDNPYDFSLGTLKAGQEVILTYRILPTVAK